MPKTTIFIGSSAAARSQAKAFAHKFEGPTLTFLPWWEAFTAGRTLLEDLDEIKDRVDAAILLMSPESESTIRGNTVQIPNLNVLFELGFLSGHLGLRTAWRPKLLRWSAHALLEAALVEHGVRPGRRGSRGQVATRRASSMPNSTRQR